MCLKSWLCSPRPDQKLGASSGCAYQHLGLLLAVLISTLQNGLENRFRFHQREGVLD